MSANMKTRHEAQQNGYYYNDCIKHYCNSRVIKRDCDQYHILISCFHNTISEFPTTRYIAPNFDHCVGYLCIFNQRLFVTTPNLR